MAATAADIMSSPAITVATQASIAELVSLLSSNRITAAPVCTANGTLAGIVSRANLVAALARSPSLLVS